MYLAQRRLGDAYQESVYYDPDSLLELHTRRKREIRDAGEEFEFGEPLRFTLHAKSRYYNFVSFLKTKFLSTKFPYLRIYVF